MLAASITPTFTEGMLSTQLRRAGHSATPPSLPPVVGSYMMAYPVRPAGFGSRPALPALMIDLPSSEGVLHHRPTGLLDTIWAKRRCEACSAVHARNCHDLQSTSSAIVGPAPAAPTVLHGTPKSPASIFCIRSPDFLPHPRQGQVAPCHVTVTIGFICLFLSDGDANVFLCWAFGKSRGGVVRHPVGLAGQPERVSRRGDFGDRLRLGLGVESRKRSSLSLLAERP